VRRGGHPLLGRLGLSALAYLLLVFVEGGQARAYRPFDSTDADVAAAGELELELGPLGLLRPGRDGDLLVAPAVIVNLGLTPRLELVLEGQHLYAVEEAAGGARSRLADNGLFLKGVARRGALQGASGPSVALEAGVLLPAVNDEPGWGLEGLAVISLGGRPGMAHLNGVLAWNRQHEPELGVGLILEGPTSWPVRPVAEGLHERILGGETLNSALLGAIWELGDALAFDGGGRVFDEDGVRGFELRLGLTWRMQLWR
jgi:hypothetical protein